MYPRDDYQEIGVRDRVYGSATSSNEGRRSIVVVLLSVSVFILVLSVSCRQTTASGPARNVIEAGVVNLTDIDQLIADEGPALRQAALESSDENVSIAGYPLDVVLSRDEILKSSDGQLRDLILERSSALIYAEGVDAFDRTGESSVRRFSLQGVMQLGVGQVSEGNHSRATFFALLGLAGCVLFGVVTAATGQGWGRMRAIGFAAAAGAVPVVLLFFLLRLMAGAIGGGDPFEDALRDILIAVLTVPIRNGLVVVGAGAAVVLGAVVLGRVEHAVTGPENFQEDADY